MLFHKPCRKNEDGLINEKDMMDKQLQNGFLANGSTNEEEVDTTEEDPEEGDLS